MTRIIGNKGLERHAGEMVEILTESSRFRGRLLSTYDKWSTQRAFYVQANKSTVFVIDNNDRLMVRNRREYITRVY